MTGTQSPEYETIRTKLPDILGAISKAPATIPQLSTRLFTQNLIPEAVDTEVQNSVAAPFVRAKTLITAVHSHVEFDPDDFDKLVRILRDCGFDNIATALEEECSKFIILL